MGKYEKGFGMGRKIINFVLTMLGVEILHSNEPVLLMEVQNFMHL